MCRLQFRLGDWALWAIRGRRWRISATLTGLLLVLGFLPILGYCVPFWKWLLPPSVHPWGAKTWFQKKVRTHAYRGHRTHSPEEETSNETFYTKLAHQGGQLEQDKNCTEGDGAYEGRSSSLKKKRHTCLKTEFYRKVGVCIFCGITSDFFPPSWFSGGIPQGTKTL